MPATEEEKAIIRALDVQVAKINTSLRFLIGIGTLLAGAALTGLWQSYQAVRLVTRIEEGVKVLQRDFGEMKQGFVEMRREVAGLADRLARVETDVAGLKRDTAELRGDVKAQSQVLDRIEKAVAQNPPGRRP